MKVYLVEMFGYEDYYRYGIYSTYESAKKKLNDVYIEECERYKNHKDTKMIWNENENSFQCTCNGCNYENYKITEDDVLNM